MKFPGSKLLHRFDLQAQRSSLEDLLRSSRDSGFTGLVEVGHKGATGLIFYYLGAEVNAVYRQGTLSLSGQTALERMRGLSSDAGGTVSVYELPLDMAHLMRGLTKRHRWADPVRSRADLVELLHRLEKTEHTGTLEIQAAGGAGMVLIVRGRISNVYFEDSNGQTYEKGAARTKLDQAVTFGEPQVFVADFSRDAWKSRHEVLVPLFSRLQRPEPGAKAPPSEESTLRRELLDTLAAEVPALLQALLFDLMTGSVYVRVGRGSADLKVSPLAELVPALTLHVRSLLEAGEDTQAETLEFLELSTERVIVLVAVVPEAQEGLALLADHSQPVALLSAALVRAARDYASRLPGARPHGVPVTP
jgi:hypothetical protein